MDLGLQGKSAIVTGGSLGIGTAIALGLAREGCDVAINYRRHDTEAKEVVRQVEAMGRKGLAVKADVASYDDAQNMVKTVVREFGGLDVLVCNAGINWDGVIWKMSEEQWDTVINVNLKGYFNYNKAAALVFKDQKSGKIVNVSSINGMRGKFAQANYAASKGGEIALSKALARELGKFNVNVNVVAPGLVMTDMARGMPPEAMAKSLGETVLGRIATVEECADVIVFLCSDKARHVTGEVIKIDGGQYI
jgi:3-oxoacyl-[acyl-carrier protein] reductase